MNVKKIFASEVKSFDDKELIVEHFISTESIDRSKDRVFADGANLDGSLVVLKQHGKDPVIGYEPIARNLEIRIGVNDKGVKGIIAKTQYYDGSHLTPPDNTGRRLYEKASKGFMPFWSIAIHPIDIKPNEFGGIDYLKYIIPEYSQVSMPDNIEAKVIKEYSSDEVKNIIERDPATLKFGILYEEPEPGHVPDENEDENEDENDEDIFKNFTLEELKIASSIYSLKSIAEKVKVSIPLQALYQLFNTFIDELLYGERTEKVIKALLKEFTALITPYAMQLTDDDSESELLKNFKILLNTKQLPENFSGSVNGDDDSFLTFELQENDDLVEIVKKNAKESVQKEFNKLRGKVV